MKKIFIVLAMVSFLFLFGEEKPLTDGLSKGSKMADFGMRKVDLEKKELSGIIWLSDFVGKRDAAGKEEKPAKKALVISFFANWCKPCIEEMPFLQKLHEKYSSAGLQILSVNFRNENEKFSDVLPESIRIVKEKSVTYPVLFDRFTNRNQLIYMGSKALLPTLVIIDADGIVAEKYQGEKSKNFEDIEGKIKILLEKEVVK